MSLIAYLDTEVNENNKKIQDFGMVIGGTTYRTSSLDEIISGFKQQKPNFICGHNFIDHDKKYLKVTKFNLLFSKIKIIDTMYLSMLLFPNKRTHKLNKPYKDNYIHINNNPKIDAEQSQILFELLQQTFKQLDDKLKQIYQQLLANNQYFSGFFLHQNCIYPKINIYEHIKHKIVIKGRPLKEIIQQHPVELAIIITFLFQTKKDAISNIILIKFPEIASILPKLVLDKTNLEEFAKNEFAINKFRLYRKNKINLFTLNSNISQKEIIQATLYEKSIIAILPTGGGKSITFQIPALITAQAYKSLTIIISPLQALMKDQVDSFRKKNKNFKVIAISGYLSMPERSNALEEIRNGIADIVYLAPESLRTKSIFNALKTRMIERFVIDEAHCLSSWGHDFRHDYWFIKKTILQLEKSNFQKKIPVSCFTATAKPEVIKEIVTYFETISIQLTQFIASINREELQYKIIEVANEQEKDSQLINILAERGKNPTLIYIPNNAKKCKELSRQLSQDERLSQLDLIIKPFYAKLDDEISNGEYPEKTLDKAQILQNFIDDKIDIVIATIAFGMGIDKPNIHTVIHYHPSDSLEAYLQESGRGARAQGKTADCIVLYAKNDFDYIFAQSNRDKVEAHEIQRIVKELKKYKRDNLYLSYNDMAKKMGLDISDANKQYDNMINTALLELEKNDILNKGYNQYSIYATSINPKINNMNAVHEALKIKDAKDELYDNMILVMQNIIKTSKHNAIEKEELADCIGLDLLTINKVLTKLQEKQILQFDNDLTIEVSKSINNDLNAHFTLEKELFNKLSVELGYQNHINLRTFNPSNQNYILLFKEIIKSWQYLAKVANKENIISVYFKQDICYFNVMDKQILANIIKVRSNIAKFIVQTLIDKLTGKTSKEDIEISTVQVRKQYNDNNKPHSEEIFHHTFVYLHDMLKSFNLGKGLLIYHQTFNLQKRPLLEERTPYQVNKHYKPGLGLHYKYKIESVHIFILFLERLLAVGWEDSKQFVKDYFSQPYNIFKKQYNLNKNHQQAITSEKRNEIIHNLNTEQKPIFDDNKHQLIMVLAGPGSGKTWALVRKIASLITIEGNKAEYFLMLAHSRGAVSEFKQRLYKLIGNQAYDLKIATFHAFAASLLGKYIDKNKDLKDIISKATKQLNDNHLSLSNTMMLVLDEYQDVGKDEYNFIHAIYQKMESPKIIAVGDDDQLIKNFGNSPANIKYIRNFKNDFSKEPEDYQQYELLTNHRSAKNLIDFANAFAQNIPNRLKQNQLKKYRKILGSIHIIQYKKHQYHYDNILQSIKTNPSNNIAILTTRNQEALELYSILMDNNIATKYINDSNKFSLGQLVELQDFLSNWKTNKDFIATKEKSDKQYQNSKNNKLKNEVIDMFFQENEKNITHNTDYAIFIFEQYLKEIKLEEFSYGKAKVIVSTIHKAKGREWDDVYLYLNEETTQHQNRLIYVGITRAKNHLYIHSKNNIFQHLKDYTDSYLYEKQVGKSAKNIILDMALTSIVISNKDSEQGIAKTKPLAGDEINIKDNKGYKDGHQVFIFSHVFNREINDKINEHYIIKKAIVQYVVYYLDKNKEKMFKQVLCHIYLQKS